MKEIRLALEDNLDVHDLLNSELSYKQLKEKRINMYKNTK